MIRPSRVAGSFYTGDAEQLKREINSYLASVGEFSPGEIVSAAVPHAGYVYSAPIAAAVFKAMERVSFDTIVIIGHEFGHYAPGVMAVLPEDTVFRTPLGDVEVDTELCQALLASDSRIICNNQVHRQEHTIEVQLPFLQMTHRAFKIVPVLFGEVTEVHCRRFAELLDELAESRSLFVLSSTDLSHYPPDKVARQLDAKTVAFAERFDLHGLCAWKEAGDWQGQTGVETPICSAGGLGVAMYWAQRHGASQALVLKRGTSCDASGDAGRVVGYSSLLFVKEKEKQAMIHEDFSISVENQQRLLQLVRDIIRAEASGQEAVIPSWEDAELSRPSAVFVTLNKLGRLRGCIGTTQASMPLLKAVATYAHAAAFEDPRFNPVASDEVKDLHIEISVLSPMQKIASPDDIIPFTHGVVVRKGHRAGLFLPQVWEQLPDKEQFMGYLCAEKAGLAFDAWKQPDVELFVFTVAAFEEKQ